MKLVNTILRIALGLLLLLFGLNKFFNYLPAFDFGDNVGAANLFSAFIDSGYMLPLIGGVEALVGLLLVIKKAVPAALLAMLPISVGIILFHAVLDPGNILPGLIVAALNVYLIARNWDNYRHLLR